MIALGAAPFRRRRSPTLFAGGPRHRGDRRAIDRLSPASCRWTAMPPTRRWRAIMVGTISAGFFVWRMRDRKFVEVYKTTQSPIRARGDRTPAGGPTPIEAEIRGKPRRAAASRSVAPESRAADGGAEGTRPGPRCSASCFSQSPQGFQSGLWATDGPQWQHYMGLGQGNDP